MNVCFLVFFFTFIPYFKVMYYPETIKKLFTKDFVENPAIESFQVGDLVINSGKLIACDPLITHDMKAFKTQFPLGKFPVTIHKERETNCIAYVEIRFNTNPVVDWQLATTEGQNVDDLEEGETFGYPVESGMGAWMDEKAQEELNGLEQHLYRRKGSDFMSIRPAEMSGLISRTQDITPIKQNQDNKPVTDQNNFQTHFRKEVDHNAKQVTTADNTENTPGKFDAKEKGKGEYFNQRKNKAKKEEKEQKVTIKARKGFDVSV